MRYTFLCAFFGCISFVVYLRWRETRVIVGKTCYVNMRSLSLHVPSYALRKWIDWHHEFVPHWKTPLNKGMTRRQCCRTLTNVLLITSVDNNTAGLVEMSRSYHQRMCLTIGCTFRVVDYRSKHSPAWLHTLGRHPSWNKVQAIYDAFKEGHKHVFWIDSDAVIVKHNGFPFPFKEDVLMSRDPAYTMQEHLRVDGLLINAGVIALKNTPWTQRLLRNLSKTSLWWKPFFKDYNYEQAALRTVLCRKPDHFVVANEWLQTRNRSNAKDAVVFHAVGSILSKRAIIAPLLANL